MANTASERRLVDALEQTDALIRQALPLLAEPLRGELERRVTANDALIHEVRS